MRRDGEVLLTVDSRPNCGYNQLETVDSVNNISGSLNLVFGACNL